MARITVRFYTTLKEKVGKGKVELEAKNVADALEELREQFGTKFTDQLYEPSGKIKDYYILLLSGRSVDRKEIKKTTLKEGDILHIFPPIAGG
ncbi:MoaD family protein [bacterium]|nr:MoaD family protein [bacterium]MBU4561034.1 MoaD family protein [bacterium]MCG2676398.1 MoaD family protein [bacterium]MCG2678324.1 MoaD family protein [bacterium]